MHDLLQRSLTEDEVNGYYSVFRPPAEQGASALHQPEAHHRDALYFRGPGEHQQFLCRPKIKIGWEALRIQGEAQKRIEKNSQA